MAEGGEALLCCMCLDPLEEPLIVPCGHNYCRTCISVFCDGEEEANNIYRCPQCKKRSSPRPVRVRHRLAELLEELERSRIQDDSYEGPEDVACDFCTRTKVKASKSCLVCMASYCEEHLELHHEVAPLKRHKLVDPSKKLQENICSQHDEVMKIFCRTDQQCICILCSMEDHKNHDMVSAAGERSEKQRELQESRAEMQKNIQDRKEDLELLEQTMKNINLSADQTVEDIENIFTELIRLTLRKSFELQKEVRSKQKTEVSRLRELQVELEQEIIELKKRDLELERLFLTEDHLQFILSYSSMSALSTSTHPSIIHQGPQNYFEEVTAVVSELTDHLFHILMDDWNKVCQTVENVDVSVPPPEPTSRAGFLQYSQDITLDPNTAHSMLELSEGNRKVTVSRGDQSRPDHPHRFTVYAQALSTEALTGRCYWEVDWTGTMVRVAVAYKSISRAGNGNECVFGHNDKSWMLFCTHNKYILFHNVQTCVSGPQWSRIGVYLDHSAGILSFYSITETMTLLHRVHTTFTEPLHAGVQMCWNQGDSAEFCQLSQEP
ncbi:tripartite motif-containing protein 16-like isoform X2 [Gouania willdenowi]|uniref:tripartite motif-containing protein 16-like isoform X2 n=1 Tax=Gouania willdenowi TaxID=441366 RepID=UPI001055F604|nr:tripartite motif-containing protein 16-like isoform X2 [Gouania willdenowi]